VRAGALVLEAYRPQALDGYQQFFLSQAGQTAPPGAASQAAFAEAYSLDSALENALREELLSTKKDGGEG
jgi:hypothetical protein